MKKKSRVKNQRVKRSGLPLSGSCAIGAALLVGAGFASAAEDKQDAASSESAADAGNNWVELSAGGMLTSGSNAQAEQSRQLPGTAFGGIEDLHFQHDVAKGTTFSLDGRAIFDNHDYNLSLSLKKEDAYFLRFNYNNFRTWYNANGGYFPAEAAWYPFQNGDNALALDRGEISFEGGLMFKDKPSVTFKYNHSYRDGEKSSTIWGQTHPGLTNPARGLVPSFYDIDEKRDAFQLDAKHHIKKTDFGVGVRYELGDLNDALKTSQFPGEPPVGTTPQERKVTDKQNVSYDMFNVNAFSETWFNPKLLLSAGFLTSHVDNNVNGSRIYGSDYDVAYTPNPGNGAGYTNLLGSAEEHQYVLNLNLMSTQVKNFAIVPSVRMQTHNWNADSSATQTLGNNSTGPFASNSDGDGYDVRERLDLRYSGFTNWVLYAQGEWTQGQGDLSESGGMYLGSPIQRDTTTDRFFQRYGAGVKWYPLRRVSVDFGGYYKKHNYDYDNTLDNTINNSPNRYPAYLVMQAFETYDGNARLTLRPLPNLTLVTRYEYQLSTVNTQPDGISGLGETQSSDMTSQIIAQNISYAPWSRLYLQLGFNYVLSETKTPTADYTQAVLNSQNNYWTVTFNTGFVLDNKTDLNLGYTYFCADDYTDNSPAGVPYGAGAQQHGINLTMVRRLTPKLRLTARYGYYHYTDQASGGHNDYDAQVLYTGLQYRF